MNEELRQAALRAMNEWDALETNEEFLNSMGLDQQDALELLNVVLEAVQRSKGVFVNLPGLPQRVTHAVCDVFFTAFAAGYYYRASRGDLSEGDL